MAKQLLPDALWAEIAPSPLRASARRAPVAAREVLTGILFVLDTAHCSGMRCWRRLRAWQAAGEALHRRILDRLNLAGAIDWSRAASLGHSCQRGGDAIGPNPTDRGKPGSKRHIMVDRNGLPLALVPTGANVHDSKALTGTIDALQPLRQARGRPRKPPHKLHADKGYDYARCRPT